MNENDIIKSRAEQLKSKIIKWGAWEVGFSCVSDVLPEGLKHLSYAVTIVFRLSDQIINDIREGPTYTYFHHYRHVNYLLDQMALKVSNQLQKWGYLAMAVPASQTVNSAEYKGLFPHKTAATMAGLGWIGKNGLFISQVHGPRVRLATVLTEMPLPVVAPVEQSRCGSCDLCVSACPALALRGENWFPGIQGERLVDVRACSTHMKNAYKHIGRGVVCGICISVCPWGKKGLKDGVF